MAVAGAAVIEAAGAPPDVLDAATAPAAGTRRVVLLGNPNVGKSALFNALTGLRATVSNYPGTTVEVYRGRLAGTATEVVDSPGLNSLLPLSEDEQVTWDLVRSVRGEDGAVVVQVADAKNLRRALLLTLQLGQLEVPTVLVLNMHDEAEARGIRVDLPGPRGGARRPGVRDGRDPRAGARRRDRGARPRAPAAQPPAAAGGRRRAGAGPAHGRHRGPGVRARVSLALPRGAARPRGRDRAPPRDARRHGGHRGLAAHRPPGHPPDLGLARAGPGPVRALRAGRRVRRRDARRPHGEAAVPRLPEPVGDRSVLAPAVGVRARPVRRRVRPDHDGPVVRPRDRAPDRADLLQRVRGARGLRLPAAARGDERPRVPADGPQRQGRAADGARPRLRHDGDAHHAHPADARRSACSRRCCWRSACPARPSSA